MLKSHGYGQTRGVRSQLLSTLPGKLLSHWVFQSMLDMDATERSFKIAVDVALFCPIYVALRRFSSPRAAAVLSALAAHTVNFATNGHVLGVLKWHRSDGASPERLEEYANAMSCRLLQTGAFEEVRIYGSFARGELHTGSDLDIRAIRRPGLIHGVRASALALVERTRSMLAGIPMDLLVWDSYPPSDRMRADEIPARFRLHDGIPSRVGAPG